MMNWQLYYSAKWNMKQTVYLEHACLFNLMTDIFFDHVRFCWRTWNLRVVSYGRLVHCYSFHWWQYKSNHVNKYRINLQLYSFWKMKYEVICPRAFVWRTFYHARFWWRTFKHVRQQNNSLDCQVAIWLTNLLNVNI